jgi:hypothetical protein
MKAVIQIGSYFVKKSLTLEAGQALTGVLFRLPITRDTETMYRRYFTLDINQAKIWSSPIYAKTHCIKNGIPENCVKTLTLLLNP